MQSEFKLESASITILTPASERGSAGVNELQEQTVELLNFQPVENRVFGGQLAFNLLTENQTARHAENLIRDQLSDLLGNDMPPLGIAAIQAPVFHSHAFSVFLKFKENISASEVAS